MGTPSNIIWQGISKLCAKFHAFITLVTINSLSHLTMKLQPLHIAYFSSFVFIRFLGDEEFELSGSIVRVRSDSVPQVKFFKSQECQQCEQLCNVTMLPASSVSRISNFGLRFGFSNYWQCKCCCSSSPLLQFGIFIRCGVW